MINVEFLYDFYLTSPKISIYITLVNFPELRNEHWYIIINWSTDISRFYLFSTNSYFLFKVSIQFITLYLVIMSL